MLEIEAHVATTKNAALADNAGLLNALIAQVQCLVELKDVQIIAWVLPLRDSVAWQCRLDWCG